jgi:hypothetical protein
MSEISNILNQKGFKIPRLSMDEEMIAVKKDPLWLVENGKIYITTKDAELIPLILNRTQLVVMKAIKALRALGKPVRIIVLKFRQPGISTLMESIIYAITSQMPNLNSLIMADKDEGAEYLFGKVSLAHDKMDLKFRTPSRPTKDGMIFKSINSHIYVGTARNLEAGHKYTYQIAHLSEFALYHHAEILMKGLNQAIPELPGTIIVEETTGDMAGGYFYNEWKKSRRGETDWVPLFLGFNLHNEYRMKLTPQEKEAWEIFERCKKEVAR